MERENRKGGREGEERWVGREEGRMKMMIERMKRKERISTLIWQISLGAKPSSMMACLHHHGNDGMLHLEYDITSARSHVVP